MAKKATPKPKAEIEPKADQLPDLKLTVGNNGRPQWRAVRPGNLSMKKRTAFLDCVAATCNFTFSAKFVGVSTTTVDALRRRDPEFAAEVRAALETGYLHLEALMLQRALAGQKAPLQISENPDEDGKLSEGEGGGQLPAAETVTNEQALRLLAHYQRTIQGVKAPKKHGGGRRPGMASEEETNAALVKRLQALFRRKQKEAGNGRAAEK